MMKKYITNVTILLYTLLICLLFSACAKNKYLHLSLKEMHIKPDLQILVLENKEFFSAPYTLAVMLDRQACGGNLVESVWWKDWQRSMLQNNLTFVFVTSQQDSLDIAIATKLDSVEAPILILPGNHKFISDLWKPGESSPLKLLIDKNSTIIYAWLSIRNEEASTNLIQKITSISSHK